AEFTALLSRQLAESAAIADRRQRDDYVALAAEVEGTLEAYLDRAIGRTKEERRERAARYLSDVVVPLVPRTKRPHISWDDTLIRFDRTGLAQMVEHFGDAIRELIDRAADAGKWVLERRRLEDAILEKLLRDAEARYRDVRARLLAGVPRTQIRGGTLSAKVLLQEDGNGSVIARMASAETAKDGGSAISTLTVDFSVSAFPSLE
ncbi:MAG TPA: hypothetical protein VHL59_12615, partial [Thermoanaerobaculia bacterium]|nr:hypothetical protein [Thermoanaerobaculia bacterium]